MLLQELIHRKVIKPSDIPSFVPSNTHYLCMMGSIAYGCATDYSDVDVYGWCIPPRDVVFPYSNGHILGFGDAPPSFEQWDPKGVIDQNKNREYDFSVYNIVKYFQLVMDNNPNMLDSLFVPQNCILHITGAAIRVREMRHTFIHKGCWKKFKGYAISQLRKCKTFDQCMNDDGFPQFREIVEFEKAHGIPHSADESFLKLNMPMSHPVHSEKYKLLVAALKDKKKRAYNVKLYGYDVKFAYHIVRLLSEAEELITEQNLTLDRKDRRELMKSIRAGLVPLEDIHKIFAEKETLLDKEIHNSKLPEKPNVPAIRQLLMDTLESHYGNLSSILPRNDDILPVTLVQDMKAIRDTLTKWGIT
jgi:uncharacterized protein